MRVFSCDLIGRDAIAILSLAGGAGVEDGAERGCRGCSSLTDVIPNTAPKCCVPPQILSEGLFKKQGHTTDLSHVLVFIYSQHKSENGAAQNELQKTSHRCESGLHPDDKHFKVLSFTTEFPEQRTSN